jgi:hypothetical protein
MNGRSDRSRSGYGPKSASFRSVRSSDDAKSQTPNGYASAGDGASVSSMVRLRSRLTLVNAARGFHAHRPTERDISQGARMNRRKSISTPFTLPDHPKRFSGYAPHPARTYCNHESR